MTEEEQYLYLSGRFEELEFIGNSMFVLGVPFDAPEEFKQRIWAAAQSYVLGNRSMDYFYKRYGDQAEFPRPTENRRKLSSMLRLCSFAVERISAQLTNGIDRTSTLGLFASESALLRLSMSFKYAAFLLMQGATYESSSVLRLCLEQIAWAYDVHLLDDDRLFDKNPTKSISRIKEIDPSAGRIYSLLSDYTHLHPKLQRTYLDFSQEYASVIYRDYDAALKICDLYVKIVDLYVKTAELISHKYFIEIKSWVVSNNGQLVPVADYSSIAESSKWLKGIKSDA